MVHAPAGHLHDDLLDRLVMVLRIDAVGRAHRARLVELGRVGIDGDDAPGLRLHRALDHRQAQRAEAEHRDTVAGLYLRRVVHGPDAGGNAAAEQADLLRRRLLVDLRQRDLGHDRVLAEGRAAHVVVQRLAFVREATAAAGHPALALGGAHRHAQVGLAGLAEFALPAFGAVHRDPVVAGRDAGPALHIGAPWG